MNAIGGYFSLELPLYEEFHKNALRLNTGRNCLEYILRVRKYSKVYIPCYTCDVVLEPFLKLGLPFSFYRINQNLEIKDDISLNQGEALLYTNYYGLKNHYAEQLAKKYAPALIIDNTQAFFSMPIKGVDTFYTCRKFFGVPDGAYLYTDSESILDILQDVSYKRMDFLLKRIDMGPEAGYDDFRNCSDNLCNNEIKKMSRLTLRLMQSIDYNAVIRKRRGNFQYLADSLSSENRLSLNIDGTTVPMVYPLFTDKKGLRDFLISRRIFVPTYWQGVLSRTDETIERDLANNLTPLPIDQRYGREEMEIIIKTIKSF